MNTEPKTATRTAEEKELIEILHRATPEQYNHIFRYATILITMFLRPENDAGKQEAMQINDRLQACIAARSTTLQEEETYYAEMEKALHMESPNTISSKALAEMLHNGRTV